MQISDLTNSGEKKKLVAAGVLGLIAIVFLWWTFVGFGPRPSNSTARPTSTQNARVGIQSSPNQTDTSQQLNDLVNTLRVVSVLLPNPNLPEAKRNIFAFYEPPAPVQRVAEVPPTTPTPTPPVLLASVSPPNVYARTADFTLEAAGDKFTPDVRIYIDGRELPTKYRSPQQVSATVPASSIANAGTRNVAVRSTDGRLYSNSLPLNVAQPPTPNYSYIGIISTTTRVDIALLQDLSTKTVINAQRGELLGGRFRLTSIADNEIVFTDTNLKIKHAIKMTEGDKGFGSPLSRPTPRVDAEDDEP